MAKNEYDKPGADGVWMNTLTACVNKVVRDGYTDSFKVTRRGLHSSSENRYFKPEEVRIINFYRFEGQSDPADNAIMYVIEAGEGLRGTLIDAYGAYSDDSVTSFMKEVEQIQKKE